MCWNGWSAVMTKHSRFPFASLELQFSHSTVASMTFFSTHIIEIRFLHKSNSRSHSSQTTKQEHICCNSLSLVLLVFWLSSGITAPSATAVLFLQHAILLVWVSLFLLLAAVWEERHEWAKPSGSHVESGWQCFSSSIQCSYSWRLFWRYDMTLM